MTIREKLEREGIVWRPRMDCPRCCTRGNLTANERIDFAQCWKCGARWSGHGHDPLGSWAARIVHLLAEQFNDALRRDDRAIEWLTEKRGLPDSVYWLTAHGLGAVPKDFDIAQPLRSAKEALKARKEELDEMDQRSRAAKRLKEELELETKALEAMVPRLEKLADPIWAGSVVYIYTDGHGRCASLNVRQFAAEVDKDKKCFRVQPYAGRRGVFCPIPTPGRAWGDWPAVIVTEGEHNHLALCAAADSWGEDWALAGFAVGGKDGADARAAKELCEGRRPLVLYDNDQVNPKTKRPAGWSLVQGLCRAMPLYAGFRPRTRSCSSGPISSSFSSTR